MLARSGRLPTSGDWAYEVKWDGFRAIVSTESGFRVRSRRGWDMTDLVPELAALPVRAILDGELVAFGVDGAPDFPLVCDRILMRRHSIAVTYVIFDLLSLNGRTRLDQPYSKRRDDLEALGLNDAYWNTPQTFHDGTALLEAVCERQLEGVVAKRRESRYRPGERGWIKIKNRDYWRYEMERESAIHRRAGRAWRDEGVCVPFCGKRVLFTIQSRHHCRGRHVREGKTMTGLRVLGALLLFIGATFAIFTAVVAIDQLYAEGSVDNGRVIAWLIGGGIYAMVIGTVLVILDAGRRWDALDRRWDAFEET